MIPHSRSDCSFVWSELSGSFPSSLPPSEQSPIGLPCLFPCFSVQCSGLKCIPFISSAVFFERINASPRLWKFSTSSRFTADLTAVYVFRKGGSFPFPFASNPGLRRIGIPFSASRKSFSRSGLSDLMHASTRCRLSLFGLSCF